MLFPSPSHRFKLRQKFLESVPCLRGVLEQPLKVFDSGHRSPIPAYIQAVMIFFRISDNTEPESWSFLRWDSINSFLKESRVGQMIEKPQRLIAIDPNI